MKNTKIYCFNFEKWLLGENKELFFVGNSRAGKSFIVKKLNKLLSSNIIEDTNIDSYFIDKNLKKEKNTIIASYLFIYYTELLKNFFFIDDILDGFFFDETFEIIMKHIPIF